MTGVDRKRRDVQGLRALAVLAVVSDHVVQAPRGGFVGVDVFFVISGFLITGLLLREHERTGRIAFTGFYRRRVRRIMPAAALVLVVTALATFLVLGPARWDVVRWDALASALFVANWRFAAIGTDYFQSGGPTSPLQHFWSLSVEEQFYLLWPWLLLGALALAGRGSGRAVPEPPGARTGRVPAGVVVGVLAVVSLVWAAFETVASPTVAYFSTPVRAWELLAGAALAVASPLFERIVTPVRHVLGWAGLAAVGAALVVTDADRGFPMPGAVLPVLGAVAFLAAGTGADRRRWAPLTDRVSGYLGDLSYSVYLWHFPVVVVLGPYLLFVLGRTRPDVRWYVIVLAVTAVLSVLGYHLVERPVLRSRWLTDAPVVRRRRRPSRSLLAGTAFAVTGVVVFGALAVNGAQGAVDVREHTGGATAQAGTGGSGDPSAAQTSLTAAIAEALRARSWPAHLTPSVADASRETLPGNTARCGSVAWLPAAECTFGDPAAPRHAVLVGDSIAQAYVPALAAVLGTGDWSLRITSMYACPFIDRAVGATADVSAACAIRRAREVQVVRDTKPDLLVVANTFVRQRDQSTGSTATAAVWNAAFRAQMREVAPSARHVVVLAPPPPDKAIASCYSNFAGPSACISSVGASSRLQMAGDQIAVLASMGASFVDTRPWFCDAAGRCPAFVGELLVKKDQEHPTEVYVEHLVPVVVATFERLHVLGDDGGATTPTPTPTPTPSSASASASACWPGTTRASAGDVGGDTTTADSSERVTVAARTRLGVRPASAGAAARS